MENPVAVQWRRLLIQSQKMTLGDRPVIEQQLMAEDKHMPTLVRLCEEQSAKCAFGNHILYHSLLRIVELKMASMEAITMRMHDRLITAAAMSHALDTVSMEKMAFLEKGAQHLVAKSPLTLRHTMAYGVLRALLLMRTRESTPEVPFGVILLYTTLFSILWICSGMDDNSRRELTTVCQSVIGVEQMSVFANILCCIHIHYGVLPAGMYEMLIKINSTNLRYSARH